MYSIVENFSYVEKANSNSIEQTSAPVPPGTFPESFLFHLVPS